VMKPEGLVEFVLFLLINSKGIANYTCQNRVKSIILFHLLKF